jgi:hypothetical protein
MSIGKALRWSVLLAALSVGSIALVLEYRLYRLPESLPKEVESAVRAVIRAEFFSEFSGAYWENEMLEQHEIISRLPLAKRLAFYRSIVLCCKLETSKAMHFEAMVWQDSESLRKYLIALRDSEKFAQLALEQREAVDAWISGMESINGLRKLETRRTNRSSKASD